jgi:long-subunit fatty acid transport protein
MVMHNISNKNMTGKLVMALVSLLFLVSGSSVFAQHRGDNLSFQGVLGDNGNGVKAQAMAGAYTSISGDIESIFWNPAGLSEIDKFQISVAANTYNRIWRENQVYRPNRQFVTLSFYLDGLYTPDPANNGVLDYEIFKEDTTYFVAEPELGQDVYSEEAADWQYEKNGFALNNIAAALPFSVSDHQFVLAAAYGNRFQLLDYDRNQTYLDPHPGTDEYGGHIERITSPGDSVRIVWSDFERTRDGEVQSINFALGYQLNSNLMLGAGINLLSSKTDDTQYLARIGYFDLVDGANSFRFSYDTLTVSTSGTSEFSATSFNLGAIFAVEHFSLGVNLTSPFTVTRKWTYQTVTETATSRETGAINGEDEMKIPLSYAFGLSIIPVESFRLAIDLKQKNYGDAEFVYAQPDSANRNWVDQKVLSIGFEYIPFDFLSVLGGYRHQTAVFVPDGAATRDEGPDINAWSVGLSVRTKFGIFDAAYVATSMKYYDSYFSNTNYVSDTLDRMLIGYKYIF